MRQSTLQELEQHHVQQVSGAGTIGDAAGCIGGVIAIGGTDGALALTGLGIATAGACIELGGDLSDYVMHVRDLF